MEAGRFLALYTAETREHLQALSRALTALGKGGRGTEAEVGQAFRAAHTIKGASAMLGFAGVTDRAHGIENRLDEFRADPGSLNAQAVEALLADADALETAVEAAIASAPPDAGPALSPTAPADPAGGDGEPGESFVEAGDEYAQIPPETVWMVRVELRPDARLGAARALLVLRAAERVGPLLGSGPSEDGLDEAFDGVLHLYFGTGVDAGAVEEAIRGAGEIAAVAFERPAVRVVEEESASRPGRRLVRVDQQRLDAMADDIGELVVLWRRLKDGGSEELAEESPEELAVRVERQLDSLQHTSLALRMVPASRLFDRFPRVVREAARELDRSVDFQVAGGEIELDRSILDELSDPLVHLLRNAVAHGIEGPTTRAELGKRQRGTLALRAARDRAGVRIEIEDDGRGVDREGVIERAVELGLLEDEERGTEIDDTRLLSLLARPGFSTAKRVTGVSGRGVGMDVVVNRIRALGGAIELETSSGVGSTFTLRLPLTFAMAEALGVRIGTERYMVPLRHVAEAVEIDEGTRVDEDGGETVRVRDEIVPLVRLGRVLRVERGGGDQDTAALVIERAGRRAALAIDEIIERERIVMKNFDAAAEMAPYFSGATLLADGRPALVVDPTSVM